MSKITFSPNSTGTATFNIASPATNTNRTLTLPDADGTVVASNSSTGYVGIGTDSPSQPLTIQATTPIIQLVDSNLTTRVANIGGENGNVTVDIDPAQTAAASFFSVNIDNSEKIRIDSSGQLGIGIAPIAKLDISDSGRRWLFRSNELHSVNTGNTAWEASVIRGSGFYVKNPSDIIKFQLESDRIYLSGSGSRGYSGYPITNPSQNLANALRAAGYIEWQTDVGAIGTSYFNSDISLKENIAPATKSASDVINAIEFVEFDWKPDTGNEGHVEVGVIAQQLQTVDPRLVSELSDKKLIVNEPALMAHMAKSLQEALAEIKALTERVKVLESNI